MLEIDRLKHRCSGTATNGKKRAKSPTRAMECYLRSIEEERDYYKCEVDQLNKVIHMLFSTFYTPMYTTNIALLRYFYDVSFDRKLHVNGQSICEVYQLHSESEQYATVSVLRDLFNCRDDIDYFNYDDITVIIDEVCTN